jgi:hypothetical protein
MLQKSIVSVFLVFTIILGMAGGSTPSEAAIDSSATQVLPSTSSTQENRLQSISCISEVRCTAVGTYLNGSINQTLIQIRNGSNWSIVPSANTSTVKDNYLKSVSCVSASFCAAVGHYTGLSAWQTLVEIWDGAQWSIVPSPNSSSSQNNFLKSVSCVSPTACMAIGYFFDAWSCGGRCANRTLAMTWNGTVWTIVPSDNTSFTEPNELRSVSCISANWCAAVGVYDDSIARRSLAQVWNGSFWSIKRTSNASDFPTRQTDFGADVLSSVSCVSSMACTAVGYYYNGADWLALLQIWDGVTWSRRGAPTTSTSDTLESISCTSSTECTAVGDSFSGYMDSLVMAWNGINWSIVPSADSSERGPNPLTSVSCVSGASCTAVGNYSGSTNYRPFSVSLSGPGRATRFHPVTPKRVLDTRTANTPRGTPGRVVSGEIMNLQIAGANGIPLDAAAVVMNVTSVNPTGSGYVTVWPSGVTQPIASNLNFAPGDVVPNLITSRIGYQGQVSLYHQGGSNDLVADVVGYYSPVNGDYFTPLTPIRALDTRTTNTPNGSAARVGQGGEVSLIVANARGVPASATAVVLNVTAVNPDAAGYVTVYPNGVNRPLASNLNFVPGDTIPNSVIVGIGTQGKVNLYNANGTIDLVADVVGYYSPDDTGKRFFPVTPVRALDTRNGTGGFSAAVGQGASINLTIRGANGIPNSASAIVMNTTAVLPTGGSFLTVWPTGVNRPLASNLNFVPGDIIPNLVQVGIGSNGKVSLFNNAGAVNLVADITGYFA